MGHPIADQCPGGRRRTRLSGLLGAVEVDQLHGLVSRATAQRLVAARAAAPVLQKPQPSPSPDGASPLGRPDAPVQPLRVLPHCIKQRQERSNLMKIREIRYPTSIELLDPDNDNMDVFVEIEDGTVFTFVVWTPANFYDQMDRDDVDYLMPGRPPIVVRKLTDENIRNAMEAFLEENNGYWFKVYYLAGDNDGAFDMKLMDESIERLRMDQQESYGDDD